MTRSNASSRNSFNSEAKSGTPRLRPKPKRCRTALASASGPAEPATMTALRFDTVRAFTELEWKVRAEAPGEKPLRAPPGPATWCRAPCEGDRAHVGEPGRR